MVDGGGARFSVDDYLERHCSGEYGLSRVTITKSCSGHKEPCFSDILDRETNIANPFEGSTKDLR